MGQHAELGDVASRISTELRRAGYVQPRWYPIGLTYLHGFAATTRLEAVNDEYPSGQPRPDAEGWRDVQRLRDVQVSERKPRERDGGDFHRAAA